MKFGQLASTMMACEGEKSAQEALFHAALSQTALYSVQGGELTLVDAAGSFTRVVWPGTLGFVSTHPAATMPSSVHRRPHGRPDPEPI
jgi:META domain